MSSLSELELENFLILFPAVACKESCKSSSGARGRPQFCSNLLSTHISRMDQSFKRDEYARELDSAEIDIWCSRCYIFTAYEGLQM